MHISETVLGREVLGEDLEQRLLSEKKLLAELRYVMSSALAKVGIYEALTLIPRQFSHHELLEDKYDHSTSLYLEWRNAQGEKQGHACIHANHQIYAEYDIIRRHPLQKMWMIEAIEAWGSLGAVKAELRLMPALAEL
jgi:hypothetical protein